MPYEKPRRGRPPIHRPGPPRKIDLVDALNNLDKAGLLTTEKLLDLLAAADAELARQAKAALFCPFDLEPKQQEFYLVKSREALYGGATRGGKTIALLASAMQYCDRPDYAALIVRKTLKDLRGPGGLIPTLHSWLAGKADWSEHDKMWRFPSGAIIQLDGLDDERTDKYKFQGFSYQFIGFDEITHFREEETYTYLSTRLSRPANSDIPLRLRATANPGGPGAAWVKKHFLTEPKEGCSYVQSFIEDNSHIDQKGLRENLSHLDDTTRLQLAEGQWIDDGGNVIFPYLSAVNAWDFETDRLPFCDYILGVDYGVTADSAFVVLGIKPNDPCVYVVQTFKKPGLDTIDVSELVKSWDKKYKFARMVGDQGGMGKTYHQTMQARYFIAIEAAQKEPKGAHMRMMSAALKRGLIKVDPKRSPDLLKEWSSARWNKESTDVVSGVPDHLLDASLYGWMACTNYHDHSAETKPLHPWEKAPETTEERQIRAEMEDFHTREDERRETPWWQEDAEEY